MPPAKSRAPRAFTYDSLDRLVTSQNPETGTICYGMWISGGNPNLEPIHQPGNPPGGGGGGGGGGSTNNSPCQGGYDAHGNLVAKTDANGTLIQYGYDALNRLTSKYAPDGGNTDFGFVYDQGVNGIGRLTTEYNPNGTAGTAFDYDALGHTIHTEWYNLNAFAWQDAMTGLQYDFAGNLTQLVYPDGRTLTQTYDAANRLAEVDDITDSSNPVVYFSGAQYFPSGALQSNTYGNGVTSTLGVNNRLQPCSEFAGASAPGPHHGTLVRTIFNRQLYYAATPETNCGAATNNNGNIAHVIEGVALDTTQDFSYDKLNRLLSASSTNRPADTSYNQSYGYDSFGNMLPTDHINTSPNYSRDAATNRLLLNGTDYTYDAAGQLVGAPAIMGYHSLWYTAEGYLRSIDNYNTGSYLYNALGERTLSNHGSSGGWDLYVYLNSQPMADYDNTGTWTDNIYANGQKIVRVANDPVNGVSTKYYLADQLGTTQMELDATGNVLWQGAFTPFGQEIVNGVAPTYLGTQPADGTSNRYKFTGKERDTESGLDYFGARYYASGMGRWTTPDWAAKAEPVPYAKLDNPQSLNLYSYVKNNPLAQIDPDGHCCEEEDEKDEVTEEASFETEVSRAGRQAHADEFNERRERTQPGSAPLSPAEVDNAEADGKLALHDMLHPQGDMLDRDTQSKVDRDIERASKGKAPMGDDGHPLELHHENQDPEGEKKTMTRTEHRLGDNFKKNHKNTGKEPSKIDRKEFKKEVERHWKAWAKKQKQ